MPKYETRVVRFSIFEADLRAGELRRNGVKVKLQNQPFEILTMLLERPGEVVTRDEMRARLWPAETFVDFDHGIKSAIRRLRDALGDSAESPTFVETLGGRGYRFVFPVEKLPVERLSDGNSTSGLAVVVPISGPAPDLETSPAAPVQRHWKLKAAIAILSLAAVASFLVSLSDEHSYLSHTRLGMLTRSIVLGRSTTTQPSVTERRLTANPEAAPVSSAVISPDGKYLAYTDKTGFYLKQVENGETHPVPLPKGFEPLAESWFPDSIHMVVSWGEDAQALPSIWQISVLGGTPRKLAEGGTYPRVSPDGSTIAYLAGNGGLGPNEIWLMQADGGRAQRIAGGPEADTRVGFSAVAWAPDGRRAVYVRTTHHPYNADETRVEIADSSSGRIDAVLSKPGLGQALAWAKDDFLYYSVREPAPNEPDFNLWRVRLNSGTAHPIGSAMRVTSDRGLAAELSVTRDGKRLALRRKQLQGAVYLADLSEGGKRFTSPKRLTMDERGAWPFSWTPDSGAVIFVSDRDGIAHIFKQSIDQTQPELLVGGNEALFIPRLNPDGTALLYLAMPNPGQSSQNVRIMRMPLTGGPPQLVLEAPWILNQQCARLPSTLCVYRTCETKQAGFFAFNSVTGASSELLPGRLKVTTCDNWSLSSDGKYLNSTNLGPNSAPEIRVVSISDGSERMIVVPHWTAIGGADWAADGKSMWVVAFNRHATGFREDGTQALLKVNLNGKITDILESDAVRFYWAIPSPDGSRVALNGSTISSNVWLLESF